jgi:hypothetical protein
MPDWSIDLTRIADPILSNMRELGRMKLLYKYGGLMCPISFLCMKDLIGLYTKGTRGNKMFVCETVDRNATSSTQNFYPSMSFCGAPKECRTVAEMCNYIQLVTSHDHTAESKFVGTYDTWILQQIQNGNINMIPGVEIGTKTAHEDPVIIDDLMSNHYIDLYKDTYGILIPAKELLNRLNYGWFVRSSARQVMESDTIIGNYLLLSIGHDQQNILEPLEPHTNQAIQHEFVGFWKLPSDAPYYGLKPNYLGNNLIKNVHP